jgi:hypothetical protein
MEIRTFLILAHGCGGIGLTPAAVYGPDPTVHFAWIHCRTARRSAWLECRVT